LIGERDFDGFGRRWGIFKDWSLRKSRGDSNLLVTVPLPSGVPMTVLVRISLFIIRQGADSFCEWAKRQEKEQVPQGMIER
jgi:hypothetical protein